jgi:hypothetical protein
MTILKGVQLTKLVVVEDDEAIMIVRSEHKR